MAYSLLITLREGLEAFLIIAIVLGYLRQINHREQHRFVWLGAGSALLLSVAAGAVVELFFSELPGAAQETVEGVTMLVAVVVLTWMIYWMRQQAKSMSRHLKNQVNLALRSGSGMAMGILAFSAVGREGLETMLFLVAASVIHTPWLYWTGAAVGLAAAVAIGLVVYRSAVKLPLKVFFNVTGAVLVVLAAGLLVGGLKELQEAGFLSMGPHLWDSSSIMADNSVAGRFLGAVLGYDASPRLGQVILYWTYLAGALALFTLGREGSSPAKQTHSPVAKPNS